MLKTNPADTVQRLYTLRTQWGRLGERLQMSAPGWATEGEKLLHHWDRWPRAYHDTRHLQACLKHHQTLQEADPSAMERPDTVELALWFHDAIYWPWKTNNEERSAHWACRFLTAEGLPPGMVEKVRQHILETRHQPGELRGDARWVVDIDLAILGQSETVYRQFEQAVRKEYRFVPWAPYVNGRSAVLQGFLDRPRIYETDHFATRLERPARDNIAMALATLADNQPF